MVWPGHRVDNVYKVAQDKLLCRASVRYFRMHVAFLYFCPHFRGLDWIRSIDSMCKWRDASSHSASVREGAAGQRAGHTSLHKRRCALIRCWLARKIRWGTCTISVSTATYTGRRRRGTNQLVVLGSTVRASLLRRKLVSARAVFVLEYHSIFFDRSLPLSKPVWRNLAAAFSITRSLATSLSTLNVYGPPVHHMADKGCVTCAAGVLHGAATSDRRNAGRANKLASAAARGARAWATGSSGHNARQPSGTYAVVFDPGWRDRGYRATERGPAAGGGAVWPTARPSPPSRGAEDGEACCCVA
jgi:hypothetical protein